MLGLPRTLTYFGFFIFCFWFSSIEELDFITLQRGHNIFCSKDIFQNKSQFDQMLSIVSWAHTYLSPIQSCRMLFRVIVWQSATLPPSSCTTGVNKTYSNCEKENNLQSGASSRAKHGGAYFSAVRVSVKDPIAVPERDEVQEC